MPMASFSTDHADILPYQFEPEYDTDELSSASSVQSDNSTQEELDENDRLISNIWCQCGNCRVLPTMTECFCCHEVHGIEHRMESGLRCVTTNPHFAIICLDIEVLKVASLARADIRQDILQDPVPNDILRYQAYRQFIYWVHQALGKNIRRVIPACAVWKICDAFPSESGQYIGFKNVY